jgi:hypothetical protein
MTKQEFQDHSGIWQNNPDFENLYAASKQGAVDLNQVLVQPGGNPIGQMYAKAQQYQKDQEFQRVQQEEADKLKAPPVDPRYQQVLEGQKQFATQFRNNIPQLATSLMGQLAEVSKKNLASEIDRTQKNYNQRGLLYSTARQGAEASDREASASDLSQKRSDINNQLYDQANQYDQSAIDTAFNMANQGQQVAGKNAQLEGDYLDMAINKQRQDMNAMSGLGKGVGQGLGYLGGYLSSTKQNGIAGHYQPQGNSAGDYGGAGGIIA